MSVALEQLQAIVQAAPDVPDAKWFATIDAPQVKRDLGINWQDIHIIHRWKNLLQGTSEGQEANLTCWLAPLTDETLQLTIKLCKSSPFCCTWLQSKWSINEIAAYWNQSTNPRLPDGRNGLLRFYDPCILGNLQPVLTPEQWQTLTAPLTQWLHIDRDGTLANINVPVQELQRDGKLTLSKTQLKQLTQAGKTDNIIFHMHTSEHLPENYDPFTTYQRISTALALLDKHKIEKSQDQYLFSTLTLDWPLTHFANPELDQALASYKTGATDLGSLVEQHSPQR